MRVAIICAAIVIAATGVAVAKEKKVVVSNAASLCSTKHSAKKPLPELDCGLTGTAKLPDGATPEKPRLGYDTNPWVVTGF
jgi:putative hemolysin